MFHANEVERNALLKGIKKTLGGPGSGPARSGDLMVSWMEKIESAVKEAVEKLEDATEGGFPGAGEFTARMRSSVESIQSIVADMAKRLDAIEEVLESLGPASPPAEPAGPAEPAEQEEQQGKDPFQPSGDSDAQPSE